MNRNVNLDALRGIAVLLVLGRHFDCFPLWTKIGWAGVDLFFVLSGFLISGLLFSEWKTRGSIDVRRFYIRRGLKLYPAFYVLVAATLGITHIWPGVTPYPVNARSIVTELLFVQNYLGGIWGHTWSLAVEEHFYVALPIVLWLMQRGSHADPFRRLPRLFGIIATATLLLRTFVGSHFSADEYVMYLTPTHMRIDGLFFGVVLSYYKHFRPEVFTKIGTSAFALIGILFALALLVMVPLESPIMHTIGFTVLYLGFGFLLARVVGLQAGRYSRVIIRPLARIGVHSYSIYLWHFAISRLMPHAGTLSFALYIALSVCVGVLMAKLIEYPVLTLRDRWFPASKSSERVAVAARADARPGVGRVAPVEVAG